MNGSVAPRREDALEALRSHWLSLGKLKSAMLASDALGLGESINEVESSAILLETCTHELFLALRGVRTLLQRVEAETGVSLSPIAVARDPHLRTLYENVLAARGTAEEGPAKEIFLAFVDESIHKEKKLGANGRAIR